jgi:polyisoprenoid-binding protein YceI
MPVLLNSNGAIKQQRRRQDAGDTKDKTRSWRRLAVGEAKTRKKRRSQIQQFTIFEFGLLSQGPPRLASRPPASPPAHFQKTLQLTTPPENIKLRPMRIALFCLFVSVLFAPISRAQDVPIVELDHKESTVKFYVKASVALAGKFDKWEGKLTFASTDATTAVLDLKIEADSVDTGSGMKNGKLKGEKFFDVKNYPTITFRSTKIVQTAPNSFEVDGDFTIRGVSNPEKLTMTLPTDATGFERIDGKMVFDRKDYGMNSGIPFIKIADHVEVTIALEAKEVKGPPLIFKQ